MCKCREFDTETGRCLSGFVARFPICRGVHSEAISERLTPHCMRMDPPPHLTRDDGLPIGWPERRQAETAKVGEGE